MTMVQISEVDLNLLRSRNKALREEVASLKAKQAGIHAEYAKQIKAQIEAHVMPKFEAVAKERDDAVAALNALKAARGITTQTAAPATASKAAPASKGADQLLGGFDTATPRQVARKDVGSVTYEGSRKVRRYSADQLEAMKAREGKKPTLREKMFGNAINI
jgi:hypothetical protein